MSKRNDVGEFYKAKSRLARVELKILEERIAREVDRKRLNPDTPTAIFIDLGNDWRYLFGNGNPNDPIGGVVDKIQEDFGEKIYKIFLGDLMTSRDENNKKNDFISVPRERLEFILDGNKKGKKRLIGPTKVVVGTDEALMMEFFSEPTITSEHKWRCVYRLFRRGAFGMFQREFGITSSDVVDVLKSESYSRLSDGGHACIRYISEQMTGHDLFKDLNEFLKSNSALFYSVDTSLMLFLMNGGFSDPSDPMASFRHLKDTDGKIEGDGFNWVTHEGDRYLLRHPRSKSPEKDHDPGFLRLINHDYIIRAHDIINVEENQNRLIVRPNEVGEDENVVGDNRLRVLVVGKDKFGEDRWVVYYNEGNEIKSAEKKNTRRIYEEQKGKIQGMINSIEEARYIREIEKQRKVCLEAAERKITDLDKKLGDEKTSRYSKTVLGIAGGTAAAFLAAYLTAFHVLPDMISGYWKSKAESAQAKLKISEGTTADLRGDNYELADRLEAAKKANKGLEQGLYKKTKRFSDLWEDMKSYLRNVEDNELVLEGPFNNAAVELYETLQTYKKRKIPDKGSKEYKKGIELARQVLHALDETNVHVGDNLIIVK